MPRNHVREQTNTESEALGEETDNFEREHQGNEPTGKTMRNKILNVMNKAMFTNTNDVNQTESADGQGGGDRNVAGGGGEGGNHADEV